MTSEEKAYIHEVVREVIRELPCEAREERIQKVERKIFNGFGTKINILFVLYTVFLGLAVKQVFF